MSIFASLLNHAARPRWSLIALCGLLIPATAWAAFSGDLETFDGTVKDTDNWIETVLAPPGESVTQNNDVTLTATILSVDYTTRFTAGVGDTVSAELLSVAADEAGLYLTNDTEGTSLPSPFDSQTLRLTYRPSVPGFIAAVGGAGGPILGFGTLPPAPGFPYILQIERNSSTVATFSVFQSDMTPIDSAALFFTTVPDRLFVSLVSTGTTAAFDNVRAPDPCGNGFPEGVEECDDGNTQDEDGCSSQCLIEECGDGVEQSGFGEECDDGNLEDEDGCSSSCLIEFCGDGTVQTALGEECEDAGQCGFGESCDIVCSCQVSTNVCGNGEIEFGEQCDDGDTLGSDGCSADCEVEQPQSRAQQRCIVELNKNLEKVAKAQGKDICACIKDGTRDKLIGQTIEECMTSDAKGHVAQAKARTLAKASSKCTEIPDFAFTDPNTVNRVAVDKDLDLAHDIFGPDLDAVIQLAADDAGTARCQTEVAKAAKKCQDAKLKEFRKCKKKGLKEVDSVQIVTRTQLAAGCMMQAGDPTTGQPDPGSKIERTCSSRLQQKIDKSCAGAADLSQAFPGCGVSGSSALTSCLDRLVECRVCLALNEADDLARDCDFFDDGLENDTCAGLGPECGNSVLEIGEMCDDGNTDSCDGCSDTCRTETGLICGDGTLNTACGEACDDGDTNSCDGCSSLCEIETGLICGDGVLNLTCGEECELDGDCGVGEACSILCTCEFVGVPVCGDSLLQSGEVCDDGNTDDGDCCSSLCQIEPEPTVCRPSVGVCDVPENCTGSSPDCPADGFVANGSACDDGDTCTADTECQSGNCQGGSTSCGNGIIDAGCGEECDDSNTTSGDGCSALCFTEFCGDGIVNDAPNEQCDDSNTNSGDGCDASCQDEFCGDGIVNDAPNEDCDPPVSGVCGGGLTCGPDCVCAGQDIGSHKCLLDPNSGIVIDTQLFPLAAPLTGSVDIDCGGIDPITGKASCACVVQQIDPFEIFGVGFVCLSPAAGVCDPGEIDCDGGNGLDLDVVSDHNIGACTGNLDCTGTCTTFCSGLGKTVFDDGCEGFCEGGARDGGVCFLDDQCPDGACNGKDNVSLACDVGDPASCLPPDGNICGCNCLSQGGAASRSGGRPGHRRVQQRCGADPSPDPGGHTHVSRAPAGGRNPGIQRDQPLRRSAPGSATPCRCH